MNGRAARAGFVSLILAPLAVVGIHSRPTGAQADPTQLPTAAAPLSSALPSSAVAPQSFSPDTTMSLATGPGASTTLSAQPFATLPGLDPESSQTGDAEPFAQSLPAPGRPVDTNPGQSDEMVTKTVAIPFRKVFQLSRSQSPGRTKIASYGQDGLLQKVYRVVLAAHHQLRYIFVSQRVLKQPVNMEVLAGYTDRESIVLPSRSGMYNRTAELDMIATGYSPSEGPGHGYCRTGMRAGYGVVAVDPRLIPLHSKLYISGYGYAVAGDTGGAIKGHRIDLGLTTRREARMVGRRRVQVYVLSGM